MKTSRSLFLSAVLLVTLACVAEKQGVTTGKEKKTCRVQSFKDREGYIVDEFLMECGTSSNGYTATCSGSFCSITYPGNAPQTGTTVPDSTDISRDNPSQ